jgi:hypothetical protein
MQAWNTCPRAYRPSHAGVQGIVYDVPACRERRIRHDVFPRLEREAPNIL